MRFFLFVVAALCAVLPALRARERTRIAALSALVASAVLAALAYQPFISHMNQYRRHAEKQLPAPKIETSQNGWTPLHAAVKAGRLDEIALLLKNGANPNAQQLDGFQFTPLLLAVDQGSTASAKILLDAAASPNQSAETAPRPLMLAAMKGDAPMAKLLLDEGADVAAKDHEGNTALIAAAMLGQTEIAGLLLKRGAPSADKDDAGKTALDHARDAKHPDIVRLLEEFEAKNTH